MKYPVPEVDLNLKHYVGDRADVIKEVQLQIKKYLRNNNVPTANRSIYSAIYNALTYYQTISSLSISGETADKTFLEKTIAQINDDYKYLSDRYNSYNEAEPVITIKARIKSPISAMEKILEKVSEYVKDGRDLRKLNDSLRDFIGIRIIVNPPAEIRALGKEAESNYCYRVFDDLMRHHGIERQLENVPKENDYDFILVNTAHDPEKLQKIKDRPKKEGFLFKPKEKGVFIPQSRPECVEPYDSYFKDYRMFPKQKLYQRIHACVHPKFGNKKNPTNIPNYIIPSQSNEPAIEYQICTASEEHFAEYGGAAHTDYKDRSFYRLRIPLLISLDKSSKKLRLDRLDESMESFYGYSFKDMFNIEYQDFLQEFDTQERDEVLAGIKRIAYSTEDNEYYLEDVVNPVFLDEKQNIGFVKNLLTIATQDELLAFYDANGILDGTIKQCSKVPKTTSRIKLYSVEKGHRVRDVKFTNQDQTVTTNNEPYIEKTMYTETSNSVEITEYEATVPTEHDEF